MTSILARGIRPSFHALIVWLILVGLGCTLVPSVLSASSDFSQTQRERSQYQGDCARPSHSAHAGSCYITSTFVDFNLSDPSLGPSPIYADIQGLGLHATRVFVPGEYTAKNLPNSGRFSVEVWRDRATQVQIGKSWKQTTDNPYTHTGPLDLILLALASVITWALVVFMLVLLIRGWRVAGQESETLAGSADTLSRSSA